MDPVKFYNKNISLTEWLDKINHRRTEAMRREDNEKRKRLALLQGVIGLPFDRPYQFPALTLVHQLPIFKEFLRQHGLELCALRLIPRNLKLPKLRMRGHTISDSLRWFKKQKIDPTQYDADFVPHPRDHVWSTIFIVNRYGVFGDITSAGHQELTQGLHRESTPIQFFYDFKDWQFSRADRRAKAHLKVIISKLLVERNAQRLKLTRQLGAQFYHRYLGGYFETTTSKEFGLWFIDYNRLLGRIYARVRFKPRPAAAGRNAVSGNFASFGKVRGRARIVLTRQVSRSKLRPGEILICRMTTPDYLPLMEKSAAIVTDLGGVLSHAAIVARELKKPCLIGTKIATKVFKDGDLVEVDANQGVVKKIN